MLERQTATDDAVEIPMFVTSVEVPASNWAAPGDPCADDSQDAEQVVVETVDQTLSPRQGTGTWPNGERAVRLGHAEEILITLAANPFDAMDVARSATVFEPPIPGLRVDVDSRRDGDFEVSWHAALHTAPFRWRPASLRLYASPSLNVTVMTIVPNKARAVSSRLFVRFGLRAARRLGEAIEVGLAARQASDS